MREFALSSGLDTSLTFGVWAVGALAVVAAIYFGLRDFNRIRMLRYRFRERNAERQHRLEKYKHQLEMYRTKLDHHERAIKDQRR